ncbi:MAG: hypothetical protein OXG04_06365 [Acidobacteria bacterium]|nr:hypothetical protein [Acidobacteriota bacterium]
MRRLDGDHRVHEQRIHPVTGSRILDELAVRQLGNRNLSQSRRGLNDTQNGGWRQQDSNAQHGHEGQ